MSNLMTTKEAAEYLKLNYMTVYKLAQRGRMPASKIGGNIQELPDKKRGFDHLMDAMRYAVYTYTLKGKRGGRVIAPVVVGEGGGRWGGLH